LYQGFQELILCTFQPYQKEYAKLKESYEKAVQDFYDSFSEKELDDYNQKWDEYYMNLRKYKEWLAKRAAQRAAKKSDNKDKPRKVSFTQYD